MADDDVDQGDGPVPPVVEPHLDVAALVDRVESELLGGPRKYTRLEVAAMSGMDAEQSRRLWRALGFATVADDEKVFTDSDLEALSAVHDLVDTVPLEPELLRAMTRMLGQTFSRLASWQGQLMLEIIAEQPHLIESAEGTADMIERLSVLLEHLQGYVWRRQLTAYFSRVASSAGDGLVGAETSLVVGFADMTQFTTLTRRATEAELRALLETFEDLANDVVSAHHGQIVKTIGDEVLFTAPTAVDGAEIALSLVESAEADERLPSLRVGLAAGPVVQRLGDVYGSTVNIASRLTSLCRPGSVLVDRVMAETLGDDERFSLRQRRPESVRGFHHLRQWRLRRAGERHSSGA